MDFFNPTCQEPPLKHKTFGLCDDQNGTKAYTDIADPLKWIATVKNDNGIEIVFTTIDKCVIKDHEHPKRGRCDAMLTTTKTLYLVELKDQKSSWKTNAMEQLVSTINFLKQFHQTALDGYTHKKVFACNKQHSRFQVIDNEENKAFYREHGFRKDFQADIIIFK